MTTSHPKEFSGKKKNLTLRHIDELLGEVAVLRRIKRRSRTTIERLKQDLWRNDLKVENTLCEMDRLKEAYEATGTKKLYVSLSSWLKTHESDCTCGRCIDTKKLLGRAGFEV